MPKSCAVYRKGHQGIFSLSSTASEVVTLLFYFLVINYGGNSLYSYLI